MSTKKGPGKTGACVFFLKEIDACGEPSVYQPGFGKFRIPHSEFNNFYDAALDVSTSLAKPAGSVIAMSDSIFRSRAIPDRVRPAMNLL